MPSTRQYRSIALLSLLALCIVYYVYNGASNTYESDFYTRTKAVIERKKTSLERDQLLADERDRADRVERLRKEHDTALDRQKDADSDSGVKRPTTSLIEPAVTEVVAGGDKRVKGQKPLKPAQESGSGSQIRGGKIVHGAPEKDSDDGVAKIGNVRKPSVQQTQEDGVVKDGDEQEAARKKEEADVEAELNDILRRGPIIVFSKSYCPYSKKAKHILLDLYSITPAPYVVELDTHPLGPGLQNHLHKSTGRRTVPNVLISGKSIGGGDDIAALHESGKLIDTINSMGGKRIMSATKKKGAPAAQKRRKFRS